MDEIWKDIKGFEGHYRISNTGKVFSFNVNRLLVLPIDRYGYKKVTLLLNGKYNYFTVHRLVALHFVPNIFKLDQINHIDGNKLNNNDYNLDWCTCQQNIKHAWEHGLSKGRPIGEEQKQYMSKLHMGVNNPIAKLNNTQVLKLRIDYKTGLKRKLIAIKYNISIRNVYKVANGEHYSNV